MRLGCVAPTFPLGPTAVPARSKSQQRLKIPHVSDQKQTHDHLACILKHSLVAIAKELIFQSNTKPG